MDTGQCCGVWKRWKAMDLDPYSKVNNQSFWALNKQDHFHCRVECFHQRRNRPYLKGLGICVVTPTDLIKDVIMD